LSTTSLDVGITLSKSQADRVEEDHYLVGEHAVDLSIDACSCGAEDGCWHLIAATIHQAKLGRKAPRRIY
jgi:hypothetical protein